MDDFGNDYQDETWSRYCEQYGFSMATFGQFDDVTFSICFEHGIDWAAQEI